MTGMTRGRGGAEEVPIFQMRQRFTEVTDRAKATGARFVITRLGKPVAAVVGMEDFEILRRYWPDERD